MAHNTPQPRAARRPLWKSVLFRTLALLLGLVPLVLAEGVCRLYGWGLPTYYDDPFVGFSDIHPLFVLDPEGERYEIPESRLKFFCPESFAATKPPGEFRIFVLGGSTVQGRPYEIDTSFTTWLELGLNAADPGRHWEVVNCGGISYATYRLVPILQECLQYEPDLIIFCEGHNEFLEDRSYAHIKQQSGYLAWTGQQVSHLRTYNLLRAGVLSLRGENPYAIPEDRPLLGPEADTRLDYKGGMELYHRDEDWRAAIIEHFEFNLRRLAALAEEADVPVLFVMPVCNLDWPPFKSQHRDDLSDEEAERFDAIIAQAREAAKRSLLEAIPLFREAIELDDRHALTHYELGQCYQELMQLDLAHESLLRAKEEDVCPLRMLTPMQERMHQVAQETATPLLDAEELIARSSPGGFPGNKWLIDHVHPKIDGHKLIARALLDKMIERSLLAPLQNWESVCDESYNAHFRSLDAAYFIRGQQRLQGEQKWAYGNVTLEREKAKKEK